MVKTISEQSVDEIITSGQLQKVHLYQVNEAYWELDDTDLWIIDGAIELQFPSGTLTIVWSTDYNMFITTDRGTAKLLGELDHKELQQGKISKIHKLAGKTVQDMQCKWVPFEVWDDEADDFVEQTTLVELLLTFNSKEKIQIAAVDYQIDDEENPVGFRYDLMSEMVIVLQHPIPIGPLA